MTPEHDALIVEKVAYIVGGDDSAFIEPGAQISALEAELAEAKEQFDHFQKLASEHRDEIQVSLTAAQARIAELEGALRNLQAILCNPEDEPCFVGSDEDRKIAREAFAVLAPTKEAKK